MHLIFHNINNLQLSGSYEESVQHSKCISRHEKTLGMSHFAERHKGTRKNFKICIENKEIIIRYKRGKHKSEL
jgi:calcineurin-like phosphoesterase family protein